jgi:hypothetical protein
MSGAMPTVLRSGPYRFFFYSNERSEPPHVHVQRDRAVAKFWLRPVAVASSSEFRGSELRQIERLIAMNADELLEAWHEFFAA